MNLLLHPHTQKELTYFTEKPSHGLLLTGADGLGKTHIARGLFTELASLAPEKLDSYSYFRSIVPEKGSISIDVLRDLLTFFKLKTGASDGLRRFVLIDGAETMTREAQNALLKLLEEPPADSLLILTTAHPERLLPTVRSRTQIISVIAPEEKEVLAYFSSLGFDETAVQKAWLLSGGSLAATENLLRVGAEPSEVIATVKKVLAGHTFERLLAVDSLTKSRDLAYEFVTALLQVASASAEQAANRRSGHIKNWHHILQSAHTAEEALSQNGNPKLVLTDLMLHL